MAHGHPIDAVWLGCIDFRLRKGRDQFIEALGLKDVDPVLLAGGAVGLASVKVDRNGESARQLKISVSLHDSKEVVLEVHFGCGAVHEFLGRTFAAESEERQFLLMKLREAAEYVRIEFPGRRIVGVLATPGANGAPASFEHVSL